MTTWAFPTRRRLHVFVGMVGPIMRRLRDPLACELVLRAGLALVRARRAPGRHYRHGMVTAEVGCP